MLARVTRLRVLARPPHPLTPSEGWAPKSSRFSDASPGPLLPTRRLRSDLPIDPYDAVFFRTDPEASTEALPSLASSMLPRPFAASPRNKVAEAFIRLSWASERRQRFVEMPSWPIVRAICDACLRAGLISGYRNVASARSFAVELRYTNDCAAIALAYCFWKPFRVVWWDAAAIRRETRAARADTQRVWLLLTADGTVLTHTEALARDAVGQVLGWFDTFPLPVDERNRYYYGVEPAPQGWHLGASEDGAHVYGFERIRLRHSEPGTPRQ